jgi:hypothetical protein
MSQTPDEETPDGRIRNREAVAKIRDTWIYKQVRERQDEFTNYRKVCSTESSAVVKCGLRSGNAERISRVWICLYYLL